ncbi:MAG: hypothetical protein K9H64_16660 [Bacteroidales bacterium]|nr:hypothetical protein [Bacteroidales bacterium]MCF8457599.1 hypothetical protein [Bacteroidales bacterium]
MRIAVIDLGTNTFNMIIVDVDADKQIKPVYQKKLPAKLGKGGINKNEIGPEAFQRGLAFLKEHAETIAQFDVDKTIAIATSAIRSAKNGSDFVLRAQLETGIAIEVIDGDREADLIFKGVSLLMPLTHEYNLVLDIGGGSCEFILANENGVKFRKSYDLGMARLLERFDMSDPVTEDEIETIRAYLGNELEDLIAEMKNYPLRILTGTSGSFDALANMVSHRFHQKPLPIDHEVFTIELNQLMELINLMYATTLRQKGDIPGMDLIRIEMIVPACIFIQYVIDNLGIERIYQSPYAIKQGAIIEAFVKGGCEG